MPGFMQENPKLIKDAIDEVFRSINYTVRNYTEKQDSENGYLVEFVISRGENEPGFFGYRQNDHENLQSFLRELTTDAMITELNKKFKLTEKIPQNPNPSTNEEQYYIYEPKNIFQGYRILDQFWDTQTMKFNPAAFAKVAKEIAEEKNQTRSRGAKSSGAIDPNSQFFKNQIESLAKEKVITMPFKDYVENLIKNQSSIPK